MTLKTLLLTNIEIHYGKFIVTKNSTYYQILKTIILPSNFYNKITIVEGWSKRDLNIILLKHFNDFFELNYDKVIADTYMIADGTSFSHFKKLLDKRFLFIKTYTCLPYTWPKLMQHLK